MLDGSPTAARQIVITRLNQITAATRVSLADPIPEMDAATMAAVALGRVPPFTPSGAQVAK